MGRISTPHIAAVGILDIFRKEQRRSLYSSWRFELVLKLKITLQTLHLIAVRKTFL